MDLDILVTVCLSSFCYWWMIPHLIVTSKEFANQLDTPYVHKSLRLAHTVRQAAIKFAMLKEAGQFKAKLAKHLWMMWRAPPANAEVSLCLADAVHAFTDATTTTAFHAKMFNLHERGWAAALHILVRVAVWMRFFSLRNTHLHTVLLARMDILFTDLNKAHTMRKKQLFSHYIDAICLSSDYEAWVWSPSQSVITAAAYIEMQQVWWYGRRGVHLHAITRLPHCLRAAIALLAIFFKATTAKTPTAKRKLAHWVAAYTNKM